NAIALVLIACLPHVGQCKSIVQHPTPATDTECTERAANLQHTLAGTIDDAGYRPIQVTCMYAYPDRDSEWVVRGRRRLLPPPWGCHSAHPPDRIEPMWLWCWQSTSPARSMIVASRCATRRDRCRARERRGGGGGLELCQSEDRDCRRRMGRGAARLSALDRPS